MTGSDAPHPAPDPSSPSSPSAPSAASAAFLRALAGHPRHMARLIEELHRRVHDEGQRWT